MTRVNELHKKWLKKPSYAKAHAAMEPEFRLAIELIEARTRAGLTQTELAKRMKTTRTVIARLESGRAKPSTSTLHKVAEATGSRLMISLQPGNKSRRGKTRAA